MTCHVCNGERVVYYRDGIPTPYRAAKYKAPSSKVVDACPACAVSAEAMYYALQHPETKRPTITHAPVIIQEPVKQVQISNMYKTGIIPDNVVKMRRKA